MGMNNFVGKFIPNLSSKTVYLRELLCDKGEFKWTVDHEQEWGRLKTLPISELVLTFFDPSKRTKILTDASKDGLGAVLLQAEGENWRPVEYTSRTMTPSECRYAQIEKECLGLVYEVERFHSYVYGYDMELVYTQGKYIVLADALSRAVVRSGEHAESSTVSEVTHHVNMIAETLPVTDAKLKKIAVETEKDRCLQQVVTHLNDGWA
ncbi:Retrovirus-related Pol polyprotein [Labeo rohita]|uniref:Retrovirus-related Pol polyprotein n=1 Tax=Labeo rohita TaxID=84645 RepID=A0ABQ8L7B8_LABRO|nr:Retrovirus-related Pol polyprotein [Labeo rohita]